MVCCDLSVESSSSDEEWAQWMADGGQAAVERAERAAAEGAVTSEISEKGAGDIGCAARPAPVPSTVFPPDPYSLDRFIKSHRTGFDRALTEIQSGRKRGHWSWFMFPVAPWVVDGRERGSAMNRQYALRDGPRALTGDAAAKALLQFPEVQGVSLRRNFLQMMQAVLGQLESGVSIIELVGTLDDPKLRSSLRLFERVSRDGVDPEINSVCSRAMRAMDPPEPRTP